MLQLAYLLVFILSIAIATFSILISYQLTRDYEHPFLKSYFYYIISFFVFCFYGIWGQLLVRSLLEDFAVSTQVKEYIFGVITLIGIPFLGLNWIMLIRMAADLSSKKGNLINVLLYLLIGIAVSVTVLFVVYQQLLMEMTGVHSPTFWEIVLTSVLEFLFYLTFTWFILVGLVSIKEDEKRQIVQRFVLLIVTATIIRWIAVYLAFDRPLFFIGSILIFFLSAAFPLLYLRFHVSKVFPQVQPGNEVQDISSFCSRFKISKRETEIVRLICQGKTNQQIADSLFISLQTVKDHTHRIYTKVGIRSRMQLVQLISK